MNVGKWDIMTNYWELTQTVLGKDIACAKTVWVGGGKMDNKTSLSGVLLRLTKMLD